MEMRLIVVCGLLLSALWVGESRCSDDDEFYDARLVTNARLVFAAELADLTQSAGNGPKHAPSDRMAQRIDTVAAGSGVVLGLHLAECREYAEGDYAPSHCGDEEVVVFELDGPADSVESEAVELSVRAAGMMLGSRLGPTRSACLGLATRAVVKRVSADGNKVRLELNARFSLRSQAAKPRDCGERTINRTFEVESRALDVRRNGSKQLFMDSHW